jgi:hypothetical protein
MKESDMRTKCSILKWYMVCGMVAWLVWGGQALAVSLYVSTDGNDRWSGRMAQANAERSDGPLASLAGARDAIRRLKSQGPLVEPVRVIVADGTYALTEPFILTSQDSGTEKCPISYEAAAGARPVFTGARFITRFRQGPDGLWEARLPDVAAGKWYFEQLFVNGRRAVRGRTPNKFYHYMGETAETPIKGERDTFRRTTSVRPDALEPLKKLSPEEIRDVTLVAYHYDWRKAQNLFRLAGQYALSPGKFPHGARRAGRMVPLTRRGAALHAAAGRESNNGKGGGAGHRKAGDLSR